MTMATAVRALRSRRASVIDLAVGLCAIASVASPWWISVPPAHLAETFGFQTPACWLAVAGVEIVLVAWFSWAMWVVTTPRFSTLGFPFIGTDLIGPGWYAAAIALLVAAGVVVKELNDREAPAGWDFWVLTTLPGYGLARLGRWSDGLAWTAFFSAALYFASTDSPDPSQFAEFGRTANVPPPYPREPEWVLLALAALLWMVSVAVTVLRRRRQLHTGD